MLQPISSIKYTKRRHAQEEPSIPFKTAELKKESNSE